MLFALHSVSGPNPSIYWQRLHLLAWAALLIEKENRSWSWTLLVQVLPLMLDGVYLQESTPLLCAKFKLPKVLMKIKQGD